MLLRVLYCQRCEQIGPKGLEESYSKSRSINAVLIQMIYPRIKSMERPSFRDKTDSSPKAAAVANYRLNAKLKTRERRQKEERNKPTT